MKPQASGTARSPLRAANVNTLPSCQKRRARRDTPYRLIAPICFCLLLSAFCFRAAGEYPIDWSTIDNGGGTSTGGVFTVSGTIGQPDASTTPMTGGGFSLVGGFWSLLSAVQTPGAPYLWVTRTATNTVAVWWAASDINWQLQATTNLVTTGSIWTVLSYTTNGADCIHIESPSAGNKFFRLHKP